MPESLKKHVTPLKAIREYCLWDMCGRHGEVTRCEDDTCPLWLYRFGHRPEAVPSRPLKAIKARCAGCGEPGRAEIERCRFDGAREDACSLYPYRLGHNPTLKGKRHGRPGAFGRQTPVGNASPRASFEKLGADTAKDTLPHENDT